MKRSLEDKLLNPRPGSKVAAAKEFGIDLTLLLENLRLTPEQRLENLQFLSFKPALRTLIENDVQFVIVEDPASLLMALSMSKRFYLSVF